MKDIHAGLTPRSTLAWIQIQKEKKDQYKHFWNYAQNIFMTKVL